MRWIAVAPQPVVELGPPLRARLFAHLGELFGAGIAVVSLALAQQLLGHLAVTRRARKLVHRLAIPFEAEPCESIEDRRDRVLGRARAVGILDAQQESAAA